MAFVIRDRVQQTGTANATHFNLTGTPTGFQAFSVLGTSNTTYYAATDVTGGWEVGRGTYASATGSIARNTVLSSSNGGALVGFSGTVTVFCTYPSSKSVIVNDSNVVSLGLNTDIFTGTQEELTITNGNQSFYAYTNNAAASNLKFYKSRSNTTFGTVLSTDTLGNISFNGALSNVGGFLPMQHIFNARWMALQHMMKIMGVFRHFQHAYLFIIEMAVTLQVPMLFFQNLCGFLIPAFFLYKDRFFI
jgi:hypothetical protein